MILNMVLTTDGGDIETIQTLTFPDKEIALTALNRGFEVAAEFEESNESTSDGTISHETLCASRHGGECNCPAITNYTEPEQDDSSYVMERDDPMAQHLITHLGE